MRETSEDQQAHPRNARATKPFEQHHGTLAEEQVRAKNGQAENWNHVEEDHPAELNHHIVRYADTEQAQ